MNENKHYTVDPEGKGLYRVGGIATLVLVIGYFLTFPVYAKVGIPPNGAEARLIYYAGHLPGWWTILGLMVSTDLLYVIIWLALYQALKGINRNLLLLAIACKGLFVILDLGVIWTNHAALFTLSSSYAAATSDAQRALLTAAAGAPAAVLDSLLLRIYAILFPSFGTLFAGFVMLKGIFSKGTAYLAFAVGITGILSVVDPLFFGASDPMHIINALLATLWYLLVGWRLYRLGQQ
jgi:hypothetical protein